jgi:hypothetical protein
MPLAYLNLLFIFLSLIILPDEEIQRKITAIPEVILTLDKSSA